MFATWRGDSLPGARTTREKKRAKWLKTKTVSRWLWPASKEGDKKLWELQVDKLRMRRWHWIRRRRQSKRCFLRYKILRGTKETLKKWSSNSSCPFFSLALSIYLVSLVNSLLEVDRQQAARFVSSGMSLQAIFTTNSKGERGEEKIQVSCYWKLSKIQELTCAKVAGLVISCRR